MSGLCVLITNLTLAHRTGTELYVRDLALGLLRRGHSPWVFCPDLGTVSDELLRSTVPVVDSLDKVSVVPDVIHGHHTLETITAMLRFPNTPALFVCHDWSAWHDTPPCLPQLRRFVAVDETCRDRLLVRHGTPVERTLVLQNAVDLTRFLPRGPLPERPRRALVLSNYAGQRELDEIRVGCESRGVTVDAVGVKFGNQALSPELLLPQYDLVFAKARCALEALACGAAVIVCDATGCGPLVTNREFARLRSLNFGRRLLLRPAGRDAIVQEIDRYNGPDAQLVTQRVRETAGLDVLLDKLLDVYREIIAEGPPADMSETPCAIAREFHRWARQWPREPAPARIPVAPIPVAAVPVAPIPIRQPFFKRMHRSSQKRLQSLVGLWNWKKS